MRNPVRRSLLGALIVIFASDAIAHGPARPPETSSDERPIQFPDTAQYKTLVVDLHTHSVFSDGHVWPSIRIAEAIADGLDAMAVTEHLEYQPHRADLPHPDRNRAFDEASAAAENTDLMVIRGSEITREAPAGHINAVFIDDANALFQVDEPPADASDAIAYYRAANAWPAQNAVDAANDQGAFVFWNHPFWSRQAPDGIARMNDFHRDNARSGKVHGIEIANGNDYSAEAHQIALDHDLALIGVSDVHELIDWDYPPAEGEHRPVTLAFAEERTAESLKDALFARRTVVWFRNLLIGRAPELNALLAASLEVEEANYRTDTDVLDIVVRNVSDAPLRLRNSGKLTLMDHGERIDIAANGTTRFSVKPGTRVTSITLPFEVENALLAPERYASIELTANPGP